MTTQSKSKVGKNKTTCVVFAKLPKDIQNYVVKPQGDDTLVLKYTFNLGKQFRTNDGFAWNAKIKLGNKIVCEVYNRGDGGSNLYTPVSKPLFKTLEQDAEVVYPDSYEALDCFLGFVDITTQLKLNTK